VLQVPFIALTLNRYAICKKAMLIIPKDSASEQAEKGNWGAAG